MGSRHQTSFLTALLLALAITAPCVVAAQPQGNQGRRGFQESAYARGYADGYRQGGQDARDGARYDPVGTADYRNADQGYDSSYGSRDSYRNNYRAGFRQGYEEGYRSGR
jgi:hypothetical protein